MASGRRRGGWRLWTAGLVASAVICLSAGPASAVEAILPYYTDTIDGVPVAYWLDDFVSFPQDFIDQLQGLGLTTSGGLAVDDLGDWSGTGVGTGSLDLILGTGAVGADNDPVVGGMVFEDPIPLPAGGGDRVDSDNYWGLDDLANDGTADLINGPVTVGQVLDYLHYYNPLNNFPVFVFDNNQAIGQGAILYVAAQVFIVNPGLVTGGTVDPFGPEVVASWALDGLLGPAPGYMYPYPNLMGPGNDTFDVPTNFDNPASDAAWVATPDEIIVTGASSTVYTIDFNRGSGKNDFYVYAPTMDLSGYNPDYLFAGRFYLAGNTDGFNEIYLTGQVGINHVIPEPGTLGLGLVALAGVGAAAWRRRRTRRA